MMQAPVFKVCNQDPTVVSLLKENNILRVFQFGRAPQNVKRPYAVWQRIAGVPENYLACRPDVEMHALQINVYDTTASGAATVMNAIESAIETHAHVMSYHNESRDPETNDYTTGLDVDWFIKRN